MHFPRPLTRYWSEVHPAAFMRGTGDFARFYGMLIDSLRVGVPSNGFGYQRWPRLPRRSPGPLSARVEEVFEGKLWREQLREWDETVKPPAISTHRELQSVDPDALSDAELVAYLTRCRDHHAQMIYQHMRFTAAPMVPTGRLPRPRRRLDRARRRPSCWALMRGTAPVSAGASESSRG